MAESVDYPLNGSVQYMRRADAAVAAGALGKLLAKQKHDGLDCEFFFGCRAAGSGDGDFAVYFLMQGEANG